MRWETGLAIALAPLVVYLSAKYTAWWDKRNGYGAEYRRVSPEKQEPQPRPQLPHDEQAPPQ